METVSLCRSGLGALPRPHLHRVDRDRAADELDGRKVVVGGWIKTEREQGKGSFAFLELNDGSCLANLRVIVDAAVFPLSQLVPTGSTSVLVESELMKTPEGANQSVELRVEKVLEVGPVDPAKYPIPKTRLTLSSFVTSCTSISAIARIRDELAYATHTLSRKNGFRYIHTPIINTSDWEGAGELPLGFLRRMEKLTMHETFLDAKLFLQCRGSFRLRHMFVPSVMPTPLGQFLSFRAEHSHTSRHLAKFWIVEPEIAFANLEVLYCLFCYSINMRLTLMQPSTNSYRKRLKLVSSMPFERISYTKAVQLLSDVTNRKFENKVEWGVDLASEHERYLTEVIFKKPVGEMIERSQREESLDILIKRIEDAGLPLELYEWYLELLHFGTVKHSGFEHMVLFATGIDNILDVIPFPRYPGRAAHSIGFPLLNYHHLSSTI
ncbi:hypothetical protein ZIOFF_002115 [Zingiber officinale]|uniref:Aminoacyl-tRNA synthetase class II (D/K/N) domain-containing protein n=1 Tax=Zingiber officinale TaxID=94328 RepID=A0A8J5HWE8_ZINOF|nr:hypothetical protein ZIOFF_002115 [Zingiber officinale]